MKYIFTSLLFLFSFHPLYAQSRTPDTATFYRWQDGQFVLQSDILTKIDWYCGPDSTLYRSYTTGAWKDSLLETYSYTNSPDSPGTHGHQSFKLIQRMQDGRWTIAGRQVYNGYGFYSPQSIVSELWVDSSWQPVSQDIFTYTYTPAGSSTSYSVIHQNQVSGSWQNEYRNTYVYYSYPSVSNELQQKWDATANDWVNYRRKITDFTAWEHPVTDTMQVWQNDTWHSDSLRVYNYDSINKTNTAVTFVYNESATLWENHLRSVTTYTVPYYSYDPGITETINQYWLEGVWQNKDKNIIVKLPHYCLLPVQLLSFTAVRQNNTANVSWQTANEVNVSSFAIQRSEDGIHFIKVGTVKANNSNLNRYSFGNDISAIAARKIYFRLQITDRDGSTQLSPVAIIDNNPPALFTASVYPNPVKNSLLLLNVYTVSPADLSITLCDMQGKTIFTQKSHVEAGNTVKPIPVGNIASGMYLLRVSNGKETKTLKIVKE